MRAYQQMADLMCHHMPQESSILLPGLAVDPCYLQTRGHEYPARFLLGEFNHGARRCRVIEDADRYRDRR
jgi:hypothetical protein